MLRKVQDLLQPQLRKLWKLSSLIARRRPFFLADLGLGVCKQALHYLGPKGKGETTCGEMSETRVEGWIAPGKAGNAGKPDMPRQEKYHRQSSSATTTATMLASCQWCWLLKAQGHIGGCVWIIMFFYTYL